MPDRQSKVPQYSFPETLEAQEEALASNPLMLRLIESRKSYAGDPHRPLYHYVNPESRLNDPNGLCRWQDRWHLFYQAYPPEDSRQHWGHAVSDDLIHWRDLPYCIYPDPEECCYSGATMVEEDRVIAMYHGTEVGNMVAISSDPLLLNWEKVAGKAVVPLKEDSRDYAGAVPAGLDTPCVFDPCIWKKGDAYYSLAGGVLPHGPAKKPIRANFLYRSEDLKHWEYLHEFVEEDRYTLVADDGACPYFWPIGDRHMLLFFSHMSGGQYLLGDYDTERDKFVVTHGAKFNFGPWGPSGVHAPSATTAGEEIVVIFNMNPGKPTKGWDQIMSLPRRLTLIGEDEIGQEPVAAVESLRGDHAGVLKTTLPANEELVLEPVSGKAMEIVAEIDAKDAPMVELNVLRSPGREEFTRIAFYRDRGYLDRLQLTNEPADTITLDTSYSSTASDARSRAPETAQIKLADDEPLKLRVFVDRSIVEVFANGRQCLAARVFPDREDSAGVSLRSQGANSELLGLDAWQMASIY